MSDPPYAPPASQLVAAPAELPLEPFSFLGKSPVGWHDSLSRTRVIRTR